MSEVKKGKPVTIEMPKTEINVKLEYSKPKEKKK